MTREEAIKRLDEQAFKELEKGHWVEDIINGKALISCSVCLHVISNYEGCFHYCPYCGKELKGVVRNDKNNFDIEIKSISYTANCLLNNEITRAKSRIDIGTDNYEMGYYVGLLKAIQIIKGGQSDEPL